MRTETPTSREMETDHQLPDSTVQKALPRFTMQHWLDIAEWCSSFSTTEQIPMLCLITMKRHSIWRFPGLHVEQNIMMIGWRTTGESLISKITTHMEQHTTKLSNTELLRLTHCSVIRKHMLTFKTLKGHQRYIISATRNAYVPLL